MAERFREKVNLQPISTGTGATPGMMSLVQKLEHFKNFAYQKAVEIGTEQAIERGVTAAGKVQLEKKDGITQAPRFKEKKFVGGVEIGAYNKALRGAYLASLNRDIRLNVSQIKDENFDDLVGFNSQIEALQKTTLQNVDPLVRQDVSDLFLDVVTSAQMSVQSENIKKDYEASKFEMENSSDLILNDALTYSNNGDFYAATRGLIDYNRSLQGQVEAGFISESQAVEKSREATVNITQENMIGGVRRLTQDGKYKEAVASINNVRETIPVGFSPDEHGKLLNNMIGELNQALSLEDKVETANNAKMNKNQNDNYSELMIGIATGELGLNDAVKLRRGKGITDSQFDKALTVLNSRGQGIDDHLLVNEIYEAMGDYENIIAEGGPDFFKSVIIANTGTSLTDKTSGELLAKLNEYSDPDFVLNNSVVKRAKSFIIPSMRVVGLAGSFDTEAERRLAKAIREFDNRVVSGEDPWQVADELISKDQIARIPKLTYGSRDDLQDALEKLQEAAKNGEIDKSTYNYEYNKIENLKELMSAQKQFNEARKDANANR